MWSPPASQPVPPASDLACVALRATAWACPVAVGSAFADEDHACVLLSGDEGWSYVLRAPDMVYADTDLPALLGEGGVLHPDGPPFQGGVVGLASYELSARLEATAPQARGGWSDLMLARYPALLAFHARSGRAFAVGRGPDPRRAAQRADEALAWLDAPRVEPAEGTLGQGVALDTSDAGHSAAVAGTVGRIAAGEIFQANLARPWRGRLKAGVRPYDLFARLARDSAAGYAAFLNLPGQAVVSNSPERFLSVARGQDGLWAESHPIKGTRPRGETAVEDAALLAELAASEKDRAENLMIVDLMRNDLSRVCAPGTVSVPELWGLRTFANVHHLVSRVRGRLAEGRTAWDAFLAAFPPGSVTGAPKLQAMSVIARHEPPRGPYCGSLFWAGCDGAMEASVLIRTVALTRDGEGWTFEARAGGGVVADSEPDAEVNETTAKIAAILKALA